MLTTTDVQKLVESALPGAAVTVTDLTGTSDHFGIRVVAEAFVGKSPIERHKMVHAALGHHLTREIHAIDLKTLTPDQAST
jgi:acid stress-induced BolA-like protein IbaG/YrbA